MPERPPPMQRKVDMRKVIDLLKLILGKFKSLFKKEQYKVIISQDIKRDIKRDRYRFGIQMSAAKRKKRNRRRNEIARESRRRNR